MVGSGPHRTEPAGSQHQDNFVNLERERDQDKHQEGTVRTTHTSKSYSKRGNHISQKQNDNRALQQEIDDLKRKLHHTQWKRPLSNSDTKDEEDNNYRQDRKSVV